MNNLNDFKNLILNNIFDYIFLILGSFLIAISFTLFLLPNNIASGGIPGLSLVLNKLFNINTAYLQFYINITLFFIAIYKLGFNFLLKTLIGSFAIPEFILLTQNIFVFNNNILTAAIAGGIGTGLGLALIVKGKAAVCGFTLLAQILHEYTKIKFSQLILLLNIIVIAFAIFIIGLNSGLYAGFSLFITFITIEMFNKGVKLCKSY